MLGRFWYRNIKVPLCSTIHQYWSEDEFCVCVQVLVHPTEIVSRYQDVFWSCRIEIFCAEELQSHDQKFNLPKDSCAIAYPLQLKLQKLSQPTVKVEIYIYVYIYQYCVVAQALDWWLPHSDFRILMVWTRMLNNQTVPARAISLSGRRTDSVL